MAAVKRVAQERDYFDETTERTLSVLIEAPAAHDALQQLRAGRPPSSADRDALAGYIATMMMRVPGPRRKALALVPATLTSTIDRLRTEVNAWGAVSRDADGVTSLLTELERVRLKYLQDVPAFILEQVRQPWPYENVLAAIAGMHWRIVRTQGPSWFLTTDNPAFFVEARGLRTEKAELTFPIASDMALLGSWQGTPR